MSFCDQCFILTSTSGQPAYGCPGHTLSHDSFRPAHLVYGTITATITVIGGFIAARMLAQRRTKATGGLRMDPADCHLFPVEP
jgi:hypothetical protein